MIVGVSGKIGSGKDEIGLFLNQNYNFTVVKFADKIKQIASMMTNTPIEMQTSQEGKKTYLDDWGMTIREFQQILGTEAVRNNLHKDAWVLATLSHYTSDLNWVVTDTRFKNEANKIKELGGIIIRIDRPDNPFPQSNHPSETELDEYTYDFTIINDGTIEDIYRKVEEVVKKIKGIT